jgi:hypothetical protein
MKRIFLASLAFISLTVANAQQMETHGGEPAGGKPANRQLTQVTPEMRAERSSQRLKAELKLTDEQTTKIKALKTETYTTAKTVAEKNPGDAGRNARVEGLKPVVVSYKEKMKSILTAEQYSTWEAQINTRYETWKTHATAQQNAKPDLEEQRIRMDLE